MFAIWDCVNERETTDLFGTPERWQMEAEAVEWCGQLNVFGGYTGFMSARFSVRKVG